MCQAISVLRAKWIFCKAQFKRHYLFTVHRTYSLQLTIVILYMKRFRTFEAIKIWLEPWINSSGQHGKFDCGSTSFQLNVELLMCRTKYINYYNWIIYISLQVSIVARPMNLVQLIYSLWSSNLSHFGRPNRVLGPVHEKPDVHELGLSRQRMHGTNADENVSGYMTGSVIFLIKSNTEVR